MRAAAIVVAVALASCAGDPRTEALGKSGCPLTGDECNKLKADRGDLFPTCTARNEATKAFWKVEDDPVIPWPADDAAQEKLCRDTYAWFHLLEDKFAAEKAANPDMQEEICFGTSPNNVREWRDGRSLTKKVWCWSMAMIYAPLAGTGKHTTFKPDEKDGSGRFTHFSPCRNRLFVQCALNNKLKIKKSHIRWTTGPMDPISPTSTEVLNTTFTGTAYGDITFTAQEMCMFRDFRSNKTFPQAKHFRDTHNPR